MKVFVPTNLVKVNIHSTSKILRPGRVQKTSPDITNKNGPENKCSSCPKQEADTAAKGCQDINCLQCLENMRGRWSDLHRISASILLPISNPNICPSTWVLIHHLPPPLLSTRNWVSRQSSTSRLLSLPFLPHNFQPSGFSIQKSLGPTSMHLLRSYPQ